MPLLEPNVTSRRRGGSLPLMAAIVLCYLVFDLVAVRLFEASQSLPTMAFIVGVVLSQFGLLGIWASLGSRPWYVRQSVAIVGVFLSYGAIAAGGRAGAIQDFFREAPSLPLIFLCLQAPLWLLRLVRGWKIISIGSPGGNSIRDARRFSLRQMFAATTVIAIAIALARVDHKVEQGVSIMAGAVVIGLMLVAPCASSALGSRTLTAGTFWIIAYAAGGAMALALLLACIAGAPDRTAIVSLETFSLAAVGSIHGLLAAGRRAGYILQRKSKRLTTP